MLRLGGMSSAGVGVVAAGAVSALPVSAESADDFVVAVVRRDVNLRVTNLASSGGIAAHGTNRVLIPVVVLAVIFGALVSGAGHANAGPPFLSPLTTNIDPGGRIVAVDVSSVSPAHAIAASDGGGLFKNDGTSTWHHIDSFLPNRMSDVRYSPDGTKLVATVGSDGTRRTIGSAQGCLTASCLNIGIWWSGDGGTTWTQGLVPTPTWQCPATVAAWGVSWSRLSSGPRVYAGTDCGLAYSSDSGVHWTLVDVTRSLSSAPDAVYAVAVHPNSGHVYVCGAAGYTEITPPPFSTGWTFTDPLPLPFGGVCDSGSIHAVTIAARPGGGETSVYVSPRDHRAWEQVNTAAWREVTPASSLATPFVSLNPTTARTVAVMPANWTHAATGDLETIVAANDFTYGYVSTNASVTLTQGYRLDSLSLTGGVPFAGMRALSIRLRYGLGSGTRINAWTALGARIVRASTGTVLAAAAANGTMVTVASNIATTTPTNSPAISFPYVNKAATFQMWSEARLELNITVTKNGVGDSVQKRVYAGEVTGTYAALDGNRVPFVRAYPSPFGNAYDLYAGDGAELFRAANCTYLGGCGEVPHWVKIIGYPIGGDPDPTSSLHVDPSDLAWDPSRLCPSLVASDGGLGAFNASSPGTCAFTGTDIGAAQGLDALEVYQVTGEPRNTSSPDLYFGTQDNDIRASTDDGTTWPTTLCCEGLAIQVPDQPNPTAGRPVTYFACSPCGSGTSGRAFANHQSNWPPPAACSLPGPYLIPGSETATSTTWLQFANPGATGCSTEFNLYKGVYTTAGVGWQRVLTVGPNQPGVRRTGSSINAAVPTGEPRISGPASDPTLYIAIYKPEINAQGQVGLLRVADPFGTAPHITRADNGLGSISTSSISGYVFESPVFAVDPFNSNHLIAGDQASQTVKETWDGGAHWYTDDQLTLLVKGVGKYDFQGRPGASGRVDISQLTTIGFDATVQDRIFVGTDQNGIIATSNGGESWQPVVGPSIPTVTSVYDDPEQTSATNDRQVVSTYGRGLWQMNFPKTHLEISSHTQTPSEISVGGSSTLSLTVANSGTVTAGSVTLIVALPAGLTFVASGSSNGCALRSATRNTGRLGPDIPGARVRCTLGALGAGAHATANIQVQAASPGGYIERAIAADPYVTDTVGPGTANSLLGVKP
jgi:uncharacterized repeat protein (TIGR01451 family)